MRDFSAARRARAQLPGPGGRALLLSSRWEPSESAVSRERAEPAEVVDLDHALGMCFEFRADAAAAEAASGGVSVPAFDLLRDAAALAGLAGVLAGGHAHVTEALAGDFARAREEACTVIITRDEVGGCARVCVCVCVCVLVFVCVCLGLCPCVCVSVLCVCASVFLCLSVSV